MLLTLAGVITFSTRMIAEEAKPQALPPDTHKIISAVGKILEHDHYQNHLIDDELSKRFLENYLNLLDYNHLYFLQSDVDDFEKRYGLKLDDAILDGKAEPAFDIYQKFSKRVEQRVALARDLLKEEYSFENDEYYSLDREKEPWPANEKEARQLWRSRIKFEILEQRLNNEKPEEIVKTLTRRYDRVLKSLRENEPTDILQLYLNALTHLYDPHTDFLAPATHKSFNINMKLSLSGIGAVLRSDDGYTKVVEIIKGGPADLDKRLKPNDRIIAVGQGDEPMVDVVDMKLDKVVEMIRGPKKTEVKLKIIPANAADSSVRKIITLNRDEVKLTEQEAKARVFERKDPEGNAHLYGVITLPSFYVDYENRTLRKSTTRDVGALVDSLKKKNVEGVILDLRSNGGGSLQEAISLTGLFIKKGPIVQVKDSGGDLEVESDTDPSMPYDGPLVVLTDRASASASEILAAALQDYGRAIIVGDDHTFGKGTVQQVVDLNRYIHPLTIDPPEAGALKFTMRKFYRISGGSTQNRGVVPDIVLPTRWDHLEISETSLKNAMPYDEIVRANYRNYNELQPLLNALRTKSAQRIQSEPEFAYMKEDLEKYESLAKDKVVSLKESKRLEEKEAAKKKIEARKKERAERMAKNPPPAFLEITLQNLEGTTITNQLAVNKPSSTRGNATGTNDLVLNVSGKDEGEDSSEDADLHGPEVDAKLEECINILADYIAQQKESVMAKSD